MTQTDTAVEAVLEPDLPIIDAHHHVWGDERQPPYPASRLFADKAVSGHKVDATVFVECHQAYRSEGPEHLRSVGETEFARGVAEDALRLGGRAAGACAGIVAFVDLTDAVNVDAALDAHAKAAGGRLRGVRQMAIAAPELPARHQSPAGLLTSEGFQAGFARFAKRNLPFDVMLTHPQLRDAVALARAFPQTTLVLDHLGGPLGVGRFADRKGEAFAEWREQLRAVAACPNVVCKLGGLLMPYTGLAAGEGRQMDSNATAAALRDHLLTAIDLFGPWRCMFESNFPVDMPSVSYVALWNGFKRITSNFSPMERAAMFHDVAARVYRLPA
ncbi:MAG: amidohydrolase family protein [Caulobacteraceae bacterium]|nr:amidohydrolase family protein [Caulobacteraceae bacterium]